jgi:proteasome lid subunit RPN8/RPN11
MQTVQPVHKPAPFTLVAGSRPMPPQWTPAVDAAARAHAFKVLPNEAAGVIEDGDFVPLANVATDPTKEVGLSLASRLRVLQSPVFFHSHPGGPACPSHADMEYQQDINKPCVIYVPETNDMFAWGDALGSSPLEGRAFRHGVFDCYSAVRDWFKLHRGVTLPEGARGWNWWAEGQDIYAQNFARAGFRHISISDATQPGDALMYRFNYPVLMHAAVVHDADRLFHHTAGLHPYDPSRVSGYAPRARWVRLAAAAVRYSP